MNSVISKTLILQPIYALRGEKLGKYRREVRDFHSLALLEMKSRQWAKLRNLIKYAFGNNSYYRSILDANKIKPEDIKTIEDFKKIPLLNKKTIQDDYHKLISDTHGRLYQRKTSGSTGMPLKFIKDTDSLAYMNAVMYEVYGWHDIKMGDPSCRIWALPAEMKSKIQIKARDLILNRIRLNSFDVSDQSSVEFFHAVRKFKPVYLYGVPSYTLDFTKRLLKAGLDPRDMKLKSIIMTGEILYQEQKKYIQDIYQCPIINEYGTTECGIIAFPCARDNMHLMLHNVFVEVMDPQTGREAERGCPGELIITELHAQAMPFIRYMLGDRLELKEGSCECGLELPIVAHIEGRLEDMITTPEGKKVAGGMLYYTLNKGIQQFKAYQRAIDRLEILIEKGPDFSEDDLMEIRKKWRVYLGDKMQVDFKIVDKIPPDRSGKLRYFVPEFDQPYEKII